MGSRTLRRARRALGVLAVTAAVALTVVTRGGATPQPAFATQPTVENSVGRVGGSDAFIGVVHNGSQVIAYVCDSLFYAEWFRGDLIEASGDRGLLEMSSASGAKLSIETSSLEASAGLEGSTPRGILETPSGVNLDFSTVASTDNSGLFRSDKMVDGRTFTGGWIVLPDGSVRGALVERGVESVGVGYNTGDRLIGFSQLVLGNIDFSQRTANVQGLGTFDLEKLSSGSAIFESFR
jgi:hypothetical protein